MKPFNYYIKEGLVRRTNTSSFLANALINKAELRLNRISKNSVDKREASIVFEDVYECVREAAQSLMEIKGYKPYSHEALISFLREERLLPLSKINILDNYRIQRNNSVYRAEEISLDKCNESIIFAKEIIPEIKEVLKTILKD